MYIDSIVRLADTHSANLFKKEAEKRERHARKGRGVSLRDRERMTTGIAQERRQMGCMGGFLQIFDRHHILTGKTKRLPSPPAVQASSSSSVSPETLKEVEKQPVQSKSPPSPSASGLRSPLPEPKTPTAESPCPRSPLPVLEFKEGTRSSWKFAREMPRLSLDSRATVDGKGSLKEIRTNSAAIMSANQSSDDDGDKNHRSPCVIARLMGLEPLPQPQSETEPMKLRRSASVSESRVNKDLFQPRVDAEDNVDSQTNQPQLNSKNVSCNVVYKEAKAQNRATVQRKKSFFDSADFFPEPNKHSISVYSEIEKRLRMRGIDEQSKDLETLNQILQALQLKGLLHDQKSSPSNFVYDRFTDEAPIVVMRPSSKSPSAAPSSLRTRAAARRSQSEVVSPRRENVQRSQSNKGRSKNGVIETHRKGSSDSLESRRSLSPSHSPKITSRKSVSDQSTTNRSPRAKKSTIAITPKPEKTNLHVPVEDDSSTVSETTESSISNTTSSQTDTERWKVEENKEGRSLLERCDKLLHSIAELQPSPVSVLDSSFYKEESSPSPVMKRSIDFKGEMEYIWGQAICGNESECDDCDFVYVSEILRASNYLPEDSDIFMFLEKRQELKGKDTSPVPTLQRRLVFDIIYEILNRNRQLPPWKAASSHTSVAEIWSEFRRIRERDELLEEDLFEVICGVMKKDLARDGWGDYLGEMSEAVLDIERLIYKDLIGETIGELTTFSPNSGRVAAFCRKLVF